DGHRWTVQLARIEAERLVGGIREGKAPPLTPSRRDGGPTLRDAIEAHVAGMRKAEKQPRSIAEFERETNKHLAAWLDRPLKSITRTECRELHDALSVKTDNGGGKYLANRVLRYFRAAWNTMSREHEDLPKSPTVVLGSTK